MEEIKAIIELLGEKRVEKLKDKLVDILVDRVRDDLESWDRYLFYPPDYEEIIGEAVDEAKETIKKMYIERAVAEFERTLGQKEKGNGKETD